MNEKMPTFESEKTMEKMEEELISLLREDGMSGEIRNETIELFTKLTIIKEETAANSNNFDIEQIKVNLWRAYIYGEAEYKDDAIENFKDAKIQIEHKLKENPNNKLFLETLAEIEIKEKEFMQKDHQTST